MKIEPLVAFWLPGAISLVLAYPVYRMLIQAKARQTVSAHLPEHQKKQGTPTMGGLIFVPALAVVLAVAQAWGALLLTVGFALIGFVDDFVVPRWMPGKRGLGWMQKLGLQFLVAGPAAAIQFAGQAPIWMAGATFLLVMVGNAMNFTDGLDLLAGGVVLAMVPGLWALGGASSLVSLMLAGSILPFLFLNAPPARLFMGDVGSLPLGGLIGLAILDSGFAGPISLTWVGAILSLSFVLLAELIPVPLQIASVKLRKGKRLFLRTPIHHAFEAKGWPESRIVATFVLVQIVASAVCITLVSRGSA
ncbi:MAG TPA: hypothetical protein PLO61_05350 [Fimbriimonadaceae bacterium]|nr:hypothetical protein [Fimbriimonadaceae bacterium]HRJ33063.1 hypothetical protein [Fimbriimonadaceae bacterium]